MIFILDYSMTQESKSSYKSVFKATSLFGGVQFYQILISIIKSKFVALLLGPYGVGIQGLLTSGTELIKQITSLGLSQSAVRNISEANATGKEETISKTIKVLRKLVWVTGLLGTVLVMILSPILSKVSFGNYDYTLPFIVLSITLLLDQICAGQKTLLQGLRRLKDLAKASAIGSTVGLFVSVPLYYLLGVKGIVPTLILNSLTALLLTWYFSKKIKIVPVSISKADIKTEGKSMVVMGVALSISSILIAISSFVLRSFIRNIGGEEEVGLFAAGFAIINTYVSMIFTAMGTDYYPRLAAVNNDNLKCRDLVNQQAEIGTLILAPLLAICLVFMPLMILILYSNKFLLANGYISWAALGMMLKMAAWPIGYLFVAKGESKIFILNEITQNIYTLVLNLIGYKLLGLTGLGISFMISQLLYFLQLFLVARYKYNFSFGRSFILYYLVQGFIVALSFSVTLISNRVTFYILGIVCILLSMAVSFKGLNEKMGLMDMIKGLKNRN
ncbi:MAG: O-antigen translocase [Dysgonamonadaceae bacterium]|nr:O-antigen translocase [Dysgonamonadaceae bacterium]